MLHPEPPSQALSSGVYGRKGRFSQNQPFLVRLISQESIVHMDNFTHLHGLVNRTAFTRYQRRQRLSKFRSDIQDAFRQGDKNALEAAKFLQANGRLDHALKLHYRAIPQGYEAFSARIARSAATERDEAEKPPYSYLYEGLKKRLGKPCEISKSFSEL